LSWNAAGQACEAAGLAELREPLAPGEELAPPVIDEIAEHPARTRTTASQAPRIAGSRSVECIHATLARPRASASVTLGAQRYRVAR
jgi:hypothetical protein